MASSSRSGFIGFAMVAVIMLVAAMMATTYISRQENKAVWEPKEKVKSSFSTVKEALAAYQKENHKLPCPADPTLAASHPNFGKPVSATCATGTPAGAQVVQDTTDSTQKMVVGALPNRELGLPDSAAQDKWGNKLTYAVSQKLTDPMLFAADPTDTQAGQGMAKMRVNGAVTTGGAYVVLSAGPDGKGAFGAKSGAQKSSCTGQGTEDAKNCDGDTEFVLKDIDTKSGAEFFDDQLLVETVDAAAQQINKPCKVSTTGNASWRGGDCISNAYTSMLHGAVVNNVANTNTADAAGTVTLTCNNGVLSYSNVVCNKHCKVAVSGTASWQDNATGTCTNATYAQVNHGTTSAGVANTNTGVAAGTVTLGCNDGVLTYASAVCNAHCTVAVSGAASWQDNANGTCTNATYAQVNHGATATGVANTNTTAAAGTTTLSCNDGVLSYSAKVCNAHCVSMPAQNWTANNCSGTPADSSHGAATSLVTNVAAGKTGTATFNCNDGVLSYASGSCNLNCPASANPYNWTASGNNCTGPGVASAVHGSTPTINNTRTYYTGSATLSCNNGTWNQTAASCAYTPPDCPAGVAGWNGTHTGCSASFPLITHGNSNVQPNTVPNKTGSGTASCFEGTRTVTGTCVNHCPAQTLSWGGNCSASFALTAAGGTSPSAANTAPGYSGSATATCSASGTWNTPSGSCNAIVNGACNNGVALGCSAGSLKAGTDNGQTSCGTNRQWVCQGAFGGSDSTTCSLYNGPCAVGACNNSTPLGCSVGSAISDNGQTGCGTTRTWVCNAAGGNSGTCSYNNGACPTCGNGAVNYPDCTVCGDGLGFTQYVTTGCPSPYTAGFAVQPQTRGSCSGGWSDNGALDTQDCSIPGQDGVCDSVSNSCVVGTPQNYAAGTCGGAETWECAGVSGGLTQSCSVANAACPACSGATDALSGASCQSWASWCYTATINLCAQSASFNSLPGGGQFRVRASLAGSSWGPAFVPEPLFNKGSAYSAYFHTGGSKHTFGYIVYDGGCNIYGQAAKGGKKSNYNWGAITLQQVTTSCPVNGGWGGWSAPACMCACGASTEWRYRNCDSPAPSGGGAYCVGAGSEDTGVYCEDYGCCGGGDGGGCTGTNHSC